MQHYILGIESSCDDTSAAVIRDDVILSNVIASQDVHKIYGGVVPELASRAHQQNIIPVIDTAIRKANIEKKELSAVAFTRGPGLLGSLLVGTSFAKAFSLGLNIPLIEVDHLHAHILCHFIRNETRTNVVPSFPFLCLTVSGGHTQFVLVRSHTQMEIIGETLDDAAGEAFDKSAKIMGLPYPGGPVIDKLAQSGDPDRFPFARPSIPGLDFSFSGLKTSVLYFIRDELRKDPYFIEHNVNDLCASIQAAIVGILMSKLSLAAAEVKQRLGTDRLPDIAIAGGVSANSGLRKALEEARDRRGWNIFIPPLAYSTDNAAMIAVAGYFKFLKGDFVSQEVAPYARSLRDT
ncbi:MAG TPA: tRNA (adenosine(37)-N6)-threonylcarbamoyltransferase complex transferase subunit TsaD [Bacteroidales bacterium]|nr:tRNA (adenosine(37)-N6)-threonylcarbamoyltransferase complex transferase subunit TsaD [Bacteroidales bacterium]HPS62498.1 tRNA (adenosine(37)-N6)-threonylcarbamoyltransferase complex transferase subunit TsaD [Bacteroidales bacterium]